MAKCGLVLSIAVVWLGSSGVAYATPQLEVQGGSVNFDHVDVGHPNGTRGITIVNIGTTTLTVASAAVVNGAWFTTDGAPGPLTLSPGANYRWEILCVPSAMGAQLGTFRVVSDTNDQAGTVTDVSLACFGDQGIVTVDPTTLDFGAVDVGSTKTLPLRVINTGNVAITSIALSLQNGVRGFAIDTSSLPLGIGPGDAVLLDATFTPVTTNSGGPLTVQVSARWHGTNTTAANLQFDGDGRHMSVQVSQATLAFGDFRFDDRPSRTFQIENTGEDEIVVLAAQFVSDVGTTSGEYAFEITHGTTTLLQLPQTVYSTDHLDIKVIAQPGNRTGPIGGHVNIHTNIPGATDQRVTLTGNATAAGISAPATLDFGAVDLDGPEQTQTLTIRNAGDARLDIQSITKQPDPADPESSNRFSLLLPVGASQLAPGAALSIDVTYRPTVQKHAGSLDALTLVATLTGALGGPAQAMIKLQGRGIDRTLVIDGAPVFPPTFRNPGDHAPVQPFPVHNSGDATLKVTGAMVIGGPVWQLLDPGPVEIPGGGTHDFQIRFSPTAIGPAPEGMLVLSDDDNLHPQVTVPLAGVGIARAVAFGPEVVDLGVVAIGSRTTIDELEATNLEPDAAFVIRTVTLSGSAALQLDDATAIALPAAASRPVAITFAPTEAGHFEATATLFLDQDEEAQAHVQIIGEAAPFRVTGGGCAAGGGVGGGAIVLLIAAGLAATRRRAAIALVVVALGARASADDVRVGAFDPTPETTGTGFQLASADVGRAGDWVASSVVSYATRLMTVTALVDGRAAEVVHPIAERSMLELGGAYAVRGRFEAGVRLPLYAQRGDPATGTTQLPPASGTALGDLTLHVKARVVQRGPFTAGAALHVTLPTSTKDQFTGGDQPTARVLGLATIAAGHGVTLALNGGAVLRETAAYRQRFVIEQGSGLAWGAGASVRIAAPLDVTAELFGEWVPASDAMLGSLSPIEGLIGAHYRAGPVAIGLAIGRGISDGLGAPALRGTFTLAFLGGGRAPIERGPRPVPVQVPVIDPDADRDGIPDARDLCPDEPEDRDGFQDDDGCPDPDNDGDGIADAQDKCPDQAETLDGFEDDDGCPDAGLPPGPPRVKAAEDAFVLGRALMAQQEYAAACAAFERSLRIDPAPGTRYNLAGCDAQIGKLATASALYSELARSDKNAERRAKSGELGTQLAPRVPKLKLVGAPPGASVTVNGKDARAWLGVETPVDFGRYVIVVVAPGHASWRRTVEIAKEAGVTAVELARGAVP